MSDGVEKEKGKRLGKRERERERAKRGGSEEKEQYKRERCLSVFDAYTHPARCREA